MCDPASRGIPAVHHTTPILLQLTYDTSTTVLQHIASCPILSALTAGATAGTVSRTLTAPFDRIKVLAQEGRVAGRTSAGGDIQLMTAIFRHVYHNEPSITAFWRGNGVNCMKAGPEYATAFAVRQALGDRFCADPAKPRALENFALGAASGFTAQSLLYPMELVKTRMAVASRGEYKGIADCIQQAYRRGGLRDLYRGMGANMAGIVPHRAIEMGMFFTLEQTAIEFRATHSQTGASEPLPLLWLTGIGLMSSVTSQLLTYPLNLARTRLQTQGVNGRPIKYTSFVDCITQVARTEGVSALFSGILPNMLKAVPASSIMYVVFRGVKTQLDQVKQASTTEQIPDDDY